MNSNLQENHFSNQFLVNKIHQMEVPNISIGVIHRSILCYYFHQNNIYGIIKSVSISANINLVNIIFFSVWIYLLLALTMQLREDSFFYWSCYGELYLVSAVIAETIQFHYAKRKAIHCYLLSRSMYKRIWLENHFLYPCLSIQSHKL